MKSVKRQSGKHSPHKDFKWVAIISGVILSLIFAVFVLPIAYTNYSYYQAEQNNPAKKLAAIMIPFAKENNLIKTEEYNGAVFFSNSVPYFNYSYQGNQSIEETRSLIKQYLERNGYQMLEKQYNNTQGITIFSLEGKTVEGNKVHVTFTENVIEDKNPSLVKHQIEITCIFTSQALN